MRNRIAIIITFVILVSLLWHIFGFSFITGNSMSGTLYDGDYIVYLKSQLLLGNPSYNDIFLFRHPIPNSNIIGKKIFIKRCLGIQNDSIKYSDTMLIRNNEFIENPKFVRHNYKLKFSKDIDVIDKLSFVNFSLVSYCREDSTFLLNLTNDEKASIVAPLKKLGHNLIVEKDQTAFLAPNQNNLNILINNPSTILYQFPLPMTDLARTKDAMVVNGYFMLGDNRPYSIDSRTFGSISKGEIVGKALLIIFGKRNGKLIFFRKLD